MAVTKETLPAPTPSSKPKPSLPIKPGVKSRSATPPDPPSKLPVDLLVEHVKEVNQQADHLLERYETLSLEEGRNLKRLQSADDDFLERLAKVEVIREELDAAQKTFNNAKTRRDKEIKLRHELPQQIYSAYTAYEQKKSYKEFLNAMLMSGKLGAPPPGLKCLSLDKTSHPSKRSKLLDSSGRTARQRNNATVKYILDGGRIPKRARSSSSASEDSEHGVKPESALKTEVEAVLKQEAKMDVDKKIKPAVNRETKPQLKKSPKPEVKRETKPEITPAQAASIQLSQKF